MTKPRILFLHRQQSAVGYYRSWLPARYLASKGYEVEWCEDKNYKQNYGPGRNKLHEWFLSQQGNFDIIYTDRSGTEDEIGYFAGLKHYSPGARMIVDFDDDFLDVPRWNLVYREYEPGKPFREHGLQHLRLSEKTVVSTPTLEEKFKPHTHSVTACLNSIDPVDWENLPVDPERADDPHLRIFYGGASGHYGDLDVTREGIEAVLRNPPVPLRLICMGSLPLWLHQLAREIPGRVVSLPWVPFKDYPAAVAWGGFDLAIAPLAEHPFNEAKSNIKWLEAGLQKIPFLCSDVGPYTKIPNNCAMKVDNTAAQWSHSLRNLLEDKELRSNLVRNSYELVKDEWTIDKLGYQWENVVQEAATLPRIETLEDTRLPNGEPTE